LGWTGFESDHHTLELAVACIERMEGFEEGDGGSSAEMAGY